jgi:hypothetical protein
VSFILILILIYSYLFSYFRTNQQFSMQQLGAESTRPLFEPPAELHQLQIYHSPHNHSHQQYISSGTHNNEMTSNGSNAQNNQQHLIHQQMQQQPSASPSSYAASHPQSHVQHQQQQQHQQHQQQQQQQQYGSQLQRSPNQFMLQPHRRTPPLPSYHRGASTTSTLTAQLAAEVAANGVPLNLDILSQIRAEVDDLVMNMLPTSPESSVADTTEIVQHKEAQRKERNRQLAKKSRERQKQNIQELESQISWIELQNHSLRLRFHELQNMMESMREATFGTTPPKINDFGTTAFRKRIRKRLRRIVQVRRNPILR